MPLESLVAGKIVAVKPNETWAAPEDRTGITQPDTLRALLHAVRPYKPRELVVTGGSGAAETEKVFRIGGLMHVLDTEGVMFFDHNRPPFTSVTLDYAPEAEVAGPQREVMVNLRRARIRNADRAESTEAARDRHGHARAEERRDVIPGRGLLRPSPIHAAAHAFAAMAKRFPIDLAVTVGHPAMTGTGPLGGHVVETGLVIASTDALAADVVGARLLGFGVQAVRHLWEAARLGIGESRLEHMTFPAISLREAIEAFHRSGLWPPADVRARMK